MDYKAYDSSGTDDDLPPPHQNRMPSGGRVSRNGRPAVPGSLPCSRIHDEIDMQARIHQLEQEAYCSILRAFKAQADSISWDKENLITELRKELRLSNEEHRELLSRVNTDETVRVIREWRQSFGRHPGLHGGSQSTHAPVPSPSISASRKKQKITPSLPSQSFGAPLSFRPQAMAAANQPSSSAGKHTPLMGAKMPMGASAKMHYAAAPSGRGQLGNRIPTGSFATERVEGAPFNPLIGRKVRTRYDNNFYEAVITEYNHTERRHALVYDMGTANETWEWVNLSEISPDNIQWEGEDPGIFHHLSYSGMNKLLGQDNGLGAGREGVLPKSQSRKGLLPSQNGAGRKGPDDIQLLHTDTLIKEVERLYNAKHPDPVEIEKANMVLKEHEQALIEAIARLRDFSNDGCGMACSNSSM